MLELAVFGCGAVLMVLELVGSRILAPYLGTSIIVWTSLIGIILGSLSLGYYLGGKVADRAPSLKTFSTLIILQSICILLTAVINAPFLAFIEASMLNNVYLSSLIATVLLFAPASIFAGMVSPYAARIKMKHIQNSGSTVGNLYALSTLGSIFGTFIGGFLLITYIGSKNILFLLSFVLLLIAVLINKTQRKRMVLILFVCLVVSVAFILMRNGLRRNKIVDVDTLYNRVRIYKAKYVSTNKEIRVMQINEDVSSAMFFTGDDLVFPYTKYYRLASYFTPTVNTALMIGGGGYSYPKDFIKKFPYAQIDVVEIDPDITLLAKRYFKLPSSTRITTYNQDARTFLNRTAKKYDVIFGDAFKAHSPPYNLTTQEIVKKYYDALTPNGSMLINIIASIKDSRGKFLRAEYKTFTSIFPHVYIFPVTDNTNGLLVQNIIVVALKNNNPPHFQSTNDELNMYLSHLWKKPIPNDSPIFTDDFCPVEQYNLGLVL